MRDELFLSSLEPFTQNSIEFLNQICQDEEPFIHLTYGSFVALNPNAMSDKLEQDFENSIVISKAELRAQIAYDLCEYYLYDKKYELAKQKVIECRDNLQALKNEYAEKQIECNKDDGGQFLFCTFSEDELQGRLMACGLFDSENVGLLYRMNESVMNKYKNLHTIFELDNVRMEIPLVNRRIVELDMEAIHANEPQKIPNDAVVRIAALNTVRSIIDANDLFSLHNFLVKYQKQNGFNAMMDTAITFLKQSDNVEHQKVLRDHFHNILLTIDAAYVKPADFELIEKSTLLSRQQIDDIKRSRQLYCTTTPLENINFSPICNMADWKLSSVKSKLKICLTFSLNSHFLNILNFFQFYFSFLNCSNNIGIGSAKATVDQLHVSGCHSCTSC